MLVAKEGLFTYVHPLALLGVVLRTLRCCCFGILSSAGGCRPNPLYVGASNPKT